MHAIDESIEFLLLQRAEHEDRAHQFLLDRQQFLLDNMGENPQDT
jgi:hypothetical protein